MYFVEAIKVQQAQVEEEVITGHIDLIQMRDGMIHIMDYKPGVKKVKPIEQLTSML